MSQFIISGNSLISVQNWSLLLMYILKKVLLLYTNSSTSHLIQYDKYHSHRKKNFYLDNKHLIKPLFEFE